MVGIAGGEFSAVNAAISRHASVYDAAVALARDTKVSAFILGGVLARVQREQSHVKEGYGGKGGWRTFIDVKLGLEYRHARYLITAYSTITSLGVDDTVISRFAALGWSKVKSILPAVTKENIGEICALAESMNRAALIAAVRERYGLPAAKPRPERKIAAPMPTTEADMTAKDTVVFRLVPKKAAYIREILQHVASVARISSSEEALYQLAVEWALHTSSAEVELSDVLDTIEKRFGITVHSSDATT